MENEVSKGEPEGRAGRIAGIYRVNSDASIEPLESAYLEAGQEIAVFITDKGIVFVIGKVAGIPER